MTSDELAAFFDRWSGLAKWIAAIAGVLVLLGVGSAFTNSVWQSKRLAYTILPMYDLQDRAFGGLVIENRGRVTLTDVQINISDLSATIEMLRMPGPHEPATVVDGGEGYSHVRIDMPRFSPGTSLPIYLLTTDIVSLDARRNFIITAAETVGKPSSEGDPITLSPSSVILIISGIVLLAVVLAVLFFRGDKEERAK